MVNDDNRKVILYIDDEVDLVEMLRYRFNGAGYRVETAFNGVQALERLKTLKPDIIICDVLMPEMDGFKFYKELKKNEETKRIPIIITTARRMMIDTFMVAGVDEFISKPFEFEDLLLKIRSLTDNFAPVAPKAKDDAVPKVSGKKVLVAGNSMPVMQKMMQDLAKKDCLVNLAQNGSEVVNKAKQFVPGTIILDVEIKVTSADEVIKKLRQLPDFQSTPIILFNYSDKSSSEADSHERSLAIYNMKTECIKSGGNKYIGSFNESTFYQSIEEFLKDG